MSSAVGPVVAPNPTVGARNSYADLLRSLAILSVVVGHWLATGVVSGDGRFVGVDALGVIHWGSWVTLVMQVVPVFFLVGGYVNGASWNRRHAKGEHWSIWVRARVLRLLVPTAGYLGLISVVVVAAELRHANALALAQAGWGVALHLWFLAAYVVVLLCTPALYAAHRRWGLLVPTAMSLLAAAIDIGVVDFRWHFIGWANYLLVWGTFHQLGFAWQDGRLSIRGRPVLLASGAVLALVALIWWGPYPVSMVGVPGARIENASPPSTALLAFGLAQSGIVLACEPVVARWLQRHRQAQSRISTAGKLTMPIYLWHMVPVVIVIEAGYPRLVGLPAIGSDAWWEQRVAWIAALSLVLAVLLAVLAALSMQMRRVRRSSDTGDLDRARQPVPRAGLLVVGIATAAVGIGLLSINGFAPHGHLNVVALVAEAVALLLVGGSAHSVAFRTRLQEA